MKNKIPLTNETSIFFPLQNAPRPFIAEYNLSKAGLYTIPRTTCEKYSLQMIRDNVSAHTPI